MSEGAIETDRLLLRRPVRQDARAIYERYAADAEVTRYLAWPRHTSIADSDAFISFSDSEWQRWPAGPLLAFSRDDGRLLGGAGLLFESPECASTGYVFARDSWGFGYATESLHAMVALAARLGVRRLYAVCHPEHRASSHVMEKCGFEPDGILPRHTIFPNLSPQPQDVLSYVLKRPRG